MSKTGEYGTLYVSGHWMQANKMHPKRPIYGDFFLHVPGVCVCVLQVDFDDCTPWNLV